MKKQGLKIRAALFLVTAALASSPVLTSVAAATKNARKAANYRVFVSVSVCGGRHGCAESADV